MRDGFEAGLDDDLNVSAALGALFDGVRELNRRIDARSLSTADAERATGRSGRWTPCSGSRRPPKRASSPLQALLDAAPRPARPDWAASDRLRDELLARGVAVRTRVTGSAGDWR